MSDTLQVQGITHLFHGKGTLGFFFFREKNLLSIIQIIRQFVLQMQSFPHDQKIN
jgi:hypothetical protein